MTTDPQVSALAYTFWSAKLLVEAGLVKKARRLLQAIPEDMYQYAVQRAHPNADDPKRRLFHYVLTAVDPVYDKAREAQLNRQFVYLMQFAAEQVCE